MFPAADLGSIYSESHRISAQFGVFARVFLSVSAAVVLGSIRRKQIGESVN